MGETPAWQELVAIARVARPQGRRGEVAVDPLTDFPERLGRLSRVFIEGDTEAAIPLAVEGSRRQGGRPILKFAGVGGIGEAEALSGKELRLPEAELAPLPEGSFYHFRLRGLTVWQAGRSIGRVEDILRTGGVDLLVVRTLAGEEVLVPLCEAICRNVDPAAGRIDIEPPPGLLELNAH